MKSSDVIKKITTDEAVQILDILAKEDNRVAKRIKQLSIRSLKEVDVDSVADDVCSELNCLEVEDLWDRSGETAHGYVDPGEEAWVMFEEALEPFEKNLKRYQELKMHSEAKNYCKGILLGIYQFENEADSKFIEWAEDAPGEKIARILSGWKKWCKDKKDIKDMESFIKKSCPDFKNG